MRRTMQALCGALVVTAITLVLSACEEEPGEDAAPPAPTTPAAPTDPPGTAQPGEPDDTTAPGTELTVGETAVVPFREGTVAITVTAIEIGDQAAFQADFDDTEGIVPYYIWFTAEDVSGQDLAFVTLPRLRAVTEEGIGTGAVLFGSSSGECEDPIFPEDSGPGASAELCSLQASPEGVEVAGVQYDHSEGGYTDSPITWWN